MVKFLLFMFFSCHVADRSNNSVTGIIPDGFKRGELRLQQIVNGNLAVVKMYNNGPSNRVGEAPRASPKGLARLPNICYSETYQYV